MDYATFDVTVRRGVLQPRRSLRGETFSLQVKHRTSIRASCIDQALYCSSSFRLNLWFDFNFNVEEVTGASYCVVWGTIPPLFLDMSSRCATEVS